MDTKQKTPKKHGKNKNDGNITLIDSQLLNELATIS